MVKTRVLNNIRVKQTHKLRIIKVLCQTLLIVNDNNLWINTVTMSVKNTAMVSITVSAKYLIIIKEIVLYHRIIMAEWCLVSESAV